MRSLASLSVARARGRRAGRAVASAPAECATAATRAPASRPAIIIRTLDEAGAIAGVLASVPERYAAGVVVVDGGSTDGTPELVESLGFRVVRQRGRGLGNALASGFQAADSDILVTMCGDGSYSGEAIPRLLGRLDDGYDLVVASRYSDGPPEAGIFSPRRRSTSQDDTFVRGLGNRLITGLCRTLFGFPTHDVLNGVKAFRRAVVGRPAAASPAYDLEMLLEAHFRGFRIGEIPIVERARAAGVSKVHVLYHGPLFLRVILRYLARRLGGDGPRAAAG